MRILCVREIFMLTILLRTLIIYLTRIMTMRIIGKRQLGELEVSELVTTLLLSEVAFLPVTNQDIPIAFAILPILTLLSLEVLHSGLLLHIPVLKKMLSVRPAILIRHGKPDAAAMKKAAYRQRSCSPTCGRRALPTRNRWSMPSPSRTDSSPSPCAPPSGRRPRGSRASIPRAGHHAPDYP